MKKKEMARIVAAAGLMLKQENMNASPTTALALMVMKTCEKK